MRAIQVSVKIWEFIRAYAVAILLIAALAAAFFEVYVLGTGPVTQEPPEGYLNEVTNVTLQWNRGTRKKPIKLQIAVDDPSFAKPLFDREMSGTTHTMNELEPGHTYYWRLMQEDDPSPVATFKTSDNAITL